MCARDFIKRRTNIEFQKDYEITEILSSLSKYDPMVVTERRLFLILNTLIHWWHLTVTDFITRIAWQNFNEHVFHVKHLSVGPILTGVKF